MTADPGTRRLERTVRLYPWFSAASGAFFWLPVFYLWFAAHLPLAQVLLLEALYYLCVVLLEVPSGWFSDRLGRRPTLIVSAVAGTLSALLFLVGGSFGLFAAAQALFAVSIAFRSGSDVALHFESLARLGRGEEFGAREARAERAGFLAGAGAALVGGAVGAIGLRWPYLLSALAGLLALAIAVAFADPEPDATDAPLPFHRQVVACAGLLRDRVLLWCFAGSVLLVVVNHVPYEFVQPFLDRIRLAQGLPEAGTPLGSGIAAAGAMLVAAWAAARSIRLRDRVGVAGSVLLAVGLQGAVMVAMALVVHPLAAAVVLLRSVPRAVSAAPLSAAIGPRLPDARRATYLSLQSLVGRLGFSGLLALLAGLAGEAEAGDWSRIRTMLLLGSGVAAGGVLLLGLARPAGTRPPAVPLRNVGGDVESRER